MTFQRQQKYLSPSSRLCLRCGKPGHIAKDCRSPLPQTQAAEQERHLNKQEKSLRSKKDLKDIQCFNCHQKGHYASNCPERSLFCMERRLDNERNSRVRQRSPHRISVPGVIKAGVVEGKEVNNILLDTRCSHTLVHRDIVA